MSSEDVKKLRDITGAGILDCRNALRETNNDVQSAIKFLKEKGLADISARATRQTNHGRIFIHSVDSRTGIVVLLCETDFVAMNSTFAQSGAKLVDELVSSNENDFNKKSEMIVSEAMSSIKENIQMSCSQIIECSDNEFVLSYIHGDVGSLGVVVKFVGSQSNNNSQELKSALRDIVLHIAAFKPQFLSLDIIPQEFIDEQKEIFTKQIDDMDKPNNVKEGIVQGKLKKFLKKLTLMEQPFVKDDKISVKSYLQSVNEQYNADVALVSYNIYEVGV